MSDMWSMLSNGAMSTFKRADSHTVRCRPTRKDIVVIYERIFRNGLFRELNMSIESHDFANILLQSNQKSNELSTNRKCKQRVTTDERTLTKILGADKDKVHGDQTLGNTGGNNNKDAAMSEEDKRNCHSYVASIMTITFNMFLNKENIIGFYFSICAISFVGFVLYSHVVRECLYGCSK